MLFGFEQAAVDVADGVITPAVVVRHPGQAFDNLFGFCRHGCLAAALFQARHFFVENRMGATIYFELDSRPNASCSEEHRQNYHDGKNHVDSRLRLARLTGDKAGHLQRNTHQED